MTLDEIIRMARESGIEANEDNGYLEWWNFAKLVAAHEREACAKVCEKRETSYQYATDPWALEHIMEAQYCATDIRARNNQ